MIAVSALAGITILPAMLAYSDGIYGVLQEDTSSLDNQIIGSIVSGTMALFWVLFIVGATNAFIKQSTPLIKWLVELSFPIYVIHLLPSEKIAETLITEGFSQTNVFILTILLTFSIRSDITLYLKIFCCIEQTKHCVGINPLSCLHLFNCAVLNGLCSYHSHLISLFVYV